MMSEDVPGEAPHASEDRPPDAAAHRSRVHYGWVIVIASTLTVCACLGIARFSLGMLLPGMGSGLGLNYSQMGLIGTINFVGYLIGALVVGRLTAAVGARSVTTTALVLIAVSLLLVSRSGTFELVALLYGLTGLGSGAANVAVMGLISQWFSRDLRGLATGVAVTGSGYAIMVSGVAIPQINQRWGADGWRVGWLLLGLTVALIAVVAGLLLRNNPQEMGLRPHTRAKQARRTPSPGSSAPAELHSGADALVVERPEAERLRALVHLGAIYFAFGITYVIYVTFIVTTMVDERGLSESRAGWFWFAIGFFSLFSGPVFGVLSDRRGRRFGLAAAFGMHTIAYLLVGIPGLPTAALYASVVFFGLAAWSIPGVVAAAVGDYLGPAAAVSAFGVLTFVFGIGQVIGPSLAGVLAQVSGSFASSYLLAAAIAGTAIILSAMLKPPTQSMTAQTHQ